MFELAAIIYMVNISLPKLILGLKMAKSFWPQYEITVTCIYA